jgi:RimJ/RimL family protein N-acetyltransferase
LRSSKRFIEWAHAQREIGHCLCFAIVPHGAETAVGIIQVGKLAPGSGTAEWGFALGQPFWGTGLFVEAAELALAFIFGTVGVRRLEARAALANGPGSGALFKVGAHREAVLCESFCRRGHRFDQALWSILVEDWRQPNAVWGPRRRLAGKARRTFRRMPPNHPERRARRDVFGRPLPPRDE